MNKQHWFVCYEEEYNRYSNDGNAMHGKIVANSMIDVPPWEFAATYTKVYARPGRYCTATVLWAYPVSAEEYEQWKDRF